MRLSIISSAGLPGRARCNIAPISKSYSRVSQHLLSHCAFQPSGATFQPRTLVFGAIGRLNMRTWYTVVLSIIAGAALGGAAIQGLHAQAKPKAYAITELESLDAQASADIAKRVQAAQAEAGGGRNLRTAGGKVVGLEGAPPPKRVD